MLILLLMASRKSSQLRRVLIAVLLGTATLFLLACGPSEKTKESRPAEPIKVSDSERLEAEAQNSPSMSPDARVDTFETLRADLDVKPDPSDGAGTVSLITPKHEEGRNPAVEVSSRHRFEILVETGPLGIAEGGGIYLHPSPFWGWDAPQTDFAQGPGYTTVETEAKGVELTLNTLGRELLHVEIGGRALAPGETVRIVYGAGERGALVDRYAEKGSRIWIAVDGNGDGYRQVIADSPSVDVFAGPATRLSLHLPSTARPGDTVPLTVAVLDFEGNAGIPFQGEVTLHGSRTGIDLPATIQLGPGDDGHKRIDMIVREEGVYRVGATTMGTQGTLQAESNPLVVREQLDRQHWGDLHGHSKLSDGTGTPEDYFRYARDVAGLDFAALTDHDHWGVRFIDSHPEMWTQIEDATASFHVPGNFVTILGYEWTSWLHGHRHILYFDDHGEVLSSMDPNYETPAQLWDGLRGKPALTFAHHSAGGPVATNWDFPPDPELEPITEVVSVHGSSEAQDAPGTIYKPVPGNFVREILNEKGFQLGFIGSGDSHNGHPGLVHVAAPPGNGGVAAVLSEDRTREGIQEAMKARRVYATNGPRIWLRVTLDGEPMGTIQKVVENSKPGASKTQDLRIRVAAVAPLEEVDIIRGDQPVERIAVKGEREWSLVRQIPALQPGEFVYVRVIQQDGGIAWSSPIYAETKQGATPQ